MQQGIIFHLFLILGLGSFTLGKRIELLRFKPSQPLPTDDFIPVYSAIKDFPSNDEAANLLVLQQVQGKPADRAQLGQVATISSSSFTEISDIEPEVEIPEAQGRNFQALPVASAELGNFQSLPALATPELQNFQNLPSIQSPELTNFQLPQIANSALGNFQPGNNEAAGSSSGRTFKHFLLLKSLLGSGGGGGCGGTCGGGGGGSGNGGFGGVIYPIIVNTPVNVTNLNNNNLTNVPAAAAAAAGGGAAAGDDPNGFRINYIGIPQTQAFPMQIPMQALQMPTQQVYQQQPTPVYHQRQAMPMAQPTYAVAMLNIPGTSSFMPFSLPQYQSQSQSSMNRNNGGGDVERRRHTLVDWSNASKNQNPWSAFANNLRGLQFL